MALKSTIFKAELQISDMDRGYYHDHSVTIAHHPSENDERMMMRLLAFALHADEALDFGEKIGGEDEPDLWLRDLTGAIDIWIEVGQPDEKQVRKACGRSRRVFIYAYSGRSADVWWGQARRSLEGIKNLAVFNLTSGVSPELAQMAQRSMKLQFTIQDGHVWVSDGKYTVHIDLQTLTAADPAY
jgi:uncharacterized protein YaeQ